MITSAILNFFNIIISGALSLLPDIGTEPTGIENAITYLANALAHFIYFEPALGTVALIIGLIITIELSIIIYQAINWVVNKIRGSG